MYLSYETSRNRVGRLPTMPPSSRPLCCLGRCSVSWGTHIRTPSLQSSFHHIQQLDHYLVDDDHVDCRGALCLLLRAGWSGDESTGHLARRKKPPPLDGEEKGCARRRHPRRKVCGMNLTRYRMVWYNLEVMSCCFVRLKKDGRMGGGWWMGSGFLVTTEIGGV